MRLGGLFEGYGGLSMAAQTVLDCDPVWFVENDPGACAVLDHHWPRVPNLGDITAVDWTQVEPVDVLTAGWPCQDISNAGKRAGIEGERSGLWRHVADAVRVLRPRYVLLENVSAVTVRGLDTVHADLAAAGFDTEWTCLPASAAGAPHRRERFFLVATDSAHHGHERAGAARRRWDGPSHGGDPAANASRDGRHEGRPEPSGQLGRPDVAERGATPADTSSEGRGARRRMGRATRPATVRNGAPAAADASGVTLGPSAEPVGRGSSAAVAGPDRQAAADADGDGREGQPQRDREPQDAEPQQPLGADADECVLEWGDYAPAIARWGSVLGRTAPSPTERGRRGSDVLSPRFVEWLMGLPEGWVTDVALSRNQQLKLLGNGVVPQQASVAYVHLLGLLTSGEVAECIA